MTGQEPGATHHKSGATVGVKISPDVVLKNRPVSPFGINVNYLRDEDRIWPEATRTVEEALKDMKVRWVRYPGGNKSDYYRFAKPPYREVDPVIYGNYQRFYKDDLLDFDEFIQLCSNLGAIPWVVVPFEYTSDNQPDEDLLEHAVAWVRYANQQNGYNVKHWEIGNENWHPRHGMKNPELTERAIEIAKAMKAVDSNIIIASSGIDFDIPGAKEFIDLPSCSGYYYPFEEHTFEDHYLNRDEPLLSNPYVRLMESDIDKDIAIVEWNYTYFKKRDVPDKNDMAVAIGNVDAAAQVYILGERLYNHIYWTTRWMEMEDTEIYGSAYTLDKKNEFTASGRAAWIIGNFFYPQALKVECSDEDLGAYSFHDPKTRRLSLIYLNRSENKKKIEAGLNTAIPIKTARHYQFAGENYKDRNPVWEVVDFYNRQDGKIPQVTLKGHSIVVIEMTY